MPLWKNYLIFTLTRLLKFFQGRGDPDRFLIVSTTGLGDTLWATPAIRALREKHPQAYIACLTTPLGEAVLKGNPHLDEMFIFRNMCALYFQLRKRKFGTVLLFHTSQRAVLPLCAVIGATRIVGTEGLQKGLDRLLTEATSGEGHEIERRLAIVGSQPSSYELEFCDVKESEWGRVIGLHPGAKDKFKQWPPEYFVEVGRRLKEELGAEIVVTGSESERNLVEKVAREMGARCVIDELSVMAGVLQKMELFITNDTGPMHLALAMKTRTIALFAPTNPAICGPYKCAHATVLAARPTCAPCLRKKCREPFCMRQITPEMVVQVAMECVCMSRS